MNQILVKNNVKNHKKNIYFIQFIILFYIFIFLIFYIAYKKILLTHEEKLSNTILKYYSLSRLYNKSSQDNISIDYMGSHIIGKIEIPLINISYPIFSECSDYLLKFSVCKFYGPNLNNIGNFCIAGHNYNNELFFSKLDNLSINDEIYITDNNFNKTKYFIYKIYEINPNDLSYISQETYREIRNNTYHM